MAKSDLEAEFITRWHQLAPGAPEPEHDKRFHPTRRWRVDFIWHDQKVAVEVEGQVWGHHVYCHVCGAQVLKRTQDGSRWYSVREAGGRHVRGMGFEKDVEKYNALVDCGYQLFRVTVKLLREQPIETIEMIQRAVERTE